MIDTLIFDFGNVFIDLNMDAAMKKAVAVFKETPFSESNLNTNKRYEQGLISTRQFISFYQKKYPQVTQPVLIDVWNSMLGEFPERRLRFLKELQKMDRYKLILLSNTNALHIDCIATTVPFFEDFRSCFDAFYLSHEIHLRKPDSEIFEFVLAKQNLKTENCFFVDDLIENTSAAEAIGIKSWTIDSENEDITSLLKTHKSLLLM